MSMVSKIRRCPSRVEYAPMRSVRDPKIGEAGHLLQRHHYSTTPGGAIQKLRRHLAGLELALGILLRSGQSEFVSRLLARLDRMRLDLCHVELDAAARVGIERRDAEDGVSRLRWYEDPTLENARLALRDAERAIESLQEFVVGLRTRHPELS